MTDVALALPANAGRRAARGPSIHRHVAWRNLWRHPGRTWLAAGGIGFAIFLVSVFACFQAGIYGPWIDLATGFQTGHLQLQHPAYQDEPRVPNTLAAGTELVRKARSLPGVVGATARAEAFALLSVGERSFGGLVVGVEPAQEAQLFALAGHLTEGEYLPTIDSAFIGAALASNLGVTIGDEIVALGTAPEGGVAVLVLSVDGIFDSGQADFDRSVVQAHLTAVQNAFELGDAVHRVVVKTDDPENAGRLRPALAQIASESRVLDWQDLVPGISQSIELDRISAQVTYWLLMLVVAMSVVNSFIMTVFERTREFGMLIAIGMRPNAIVGMLTIEAVCVWALGAVIGTVLCIATVIPLNYVGITFTGELEQAYQGFGMPDTLRPALSLGAMIYAPLVMLGGVVLGGLIPALRVRRMHPVEALREEE